MENSYIPFPSSTYTTTNTILRQPNMGCSQNSEFSIYEPMNSNKFSSEPVITTTASNSQFHHPPQFMSPYQSPTLPFRHPIEQAGHSLAYPFFTGQNGIEFDVLNTIDASNGVQGSCFMQTDKPSKEQETKAARIKRKLARQRSLSLKINASSAATTQVDKRRPNTFGADTNNNNDTKRDLYMFYTPDDKRLRVLLRKELKNSDVGSLGRIVLPKREAELNLPILSDKEGIQVMMKNVYSNQLWTLKYKFWSNNKSRMYVLENTGDFVKQNALEVGDSLTLYEDEGKNLYFSIKKVERVATEPSNNQHSENNYMHMPFTGQFRDEEETCLELLVQQQQQEEEPNDLMALAMDGHPHDEFGHFAPDVNIANIETYDQMTATTLQTSSTSLRVDNIQINIDDCYYGLDMLPDVNHYNFSL